MISRVARRASAGTGGWSIAHAIPGRVRLKASQLRIDPDLGHQVQELFSRIPGICSARVNQRTGSLVIEYARTAFRESTDRVSFWAAVAELLPGCQDAGVLSICIPWLTSNVAWAKAMEESIGELSAVHQVDVNSTTGQLEVRFDPAGLSPVTVVDTLSALSS
ncbi:MAG: hypothetical protein PVI02_03480, partial [Gammaproteobacteria bacterium]